VGDRKGYNTVDGSGFCDLSAERLITGYVLDIGGCVARSVDGTVSINDSDGVG
jgi:hypothetical protein